MRSTLMVKISTIVVLAFTALILSTGVEEVCAQDGASGSSNNKCPDEVALALRTAKSHAASKGDLTLKDVTTDDAFFVKLAEIPDPLRSEVANQFRQGLAMCYGNAPASIGDGTEKACDDARTALATAIGEFSAACTAAQLPSSSGLGEIECSAEVRKCDGRGGRSTDDYDYYVPDSDEILSNINNAAQGNSQGTFRKVTPTEGPTCKIQAAKGIEDWQDTVKENQERVNELQKSILDAEAAVTDLEAEKGRFLRKIENDGIAAKEEAEDEEEQLRSDMQDFDQALQDQVTNLFDMIDDIDFKITELTNAKVSAYNIFRVAQEKLNDLCHAAALRKVEQLRLQKEAEIKASIHSVGGFNKVVSQTGLSNWEVSQLLTKKYYDDCIADRTYASNMGIAERTFNQAINNANNAIAFQEKRMVKVNQQITDLQGNKKLQGLENIQRRLERLNSRLSTRLKQLEKEYYMEAEAFEKQIANKKKEVAMLQMQLMEAHNFLTQRRNYLEQKQRAAGGTSLSEDQASEVFKTFGKVSGAYYGVWQACGSAPPSSTAQKACVSAAHFIGDGLDLCSSSDNGGTIPGGGDSSDSVE